MKLRSSFEIQYFSNDNKTFYENIIKIIVNMKAESIIIFNV